MCLFAFDIDDDHIQQTSDQRQRPTQGANHTFVPGAQLAKTGQEGKQRDQRLKRLQGEENRDSRGRTVSVVSKEKASRSTESGPAARPADREEKKRGERPRHRRRQEGRSKKKNGSRGCRRFRLGTVCDCPTKSRSVHRGLGLGNGAAEARYRTYQLTLLCRDTTRRRGHETKGAKSGGSSIPAAPPLFQPPSSTATKRVVGPLHTPGPKSSVNRHGFILRCRCLTPDGRRRHHPRDARSRQ